MNDDDAYLWDRTGPPDRDVERLEKLLAPVGRGTDEGAAPIPPVPATARHRRIAWAAAAAALVAAAVVGTVLRNGTEVPSGEIARTPGGDAAVDPLADPPVDPLVDPGDGTGPALHCEGTSERLVPGAWIEAADAERHLVLGDVGRIRMEPGTRVQVRRLADDATRLYLARGRLEASVSADARPRFFQVDTDAARCVDLGCRYTLSVDAQGVAHVAVTAGQVAFEADGREVFVPTGAECSARPGAGPGTPRFHDAARDVAEAFDAYDASPRGDAETRRRRALAAVALVKTERDTLSAWHLLQDPDPVVANAAVVRLDVVTSGGTVASLCRIEPQEKDRAAWKEFLVGRCW